MAAAKEEGAPGDAGGANSNPMVNGDADATIGGEQPTEPALDGVKQELVQELLQGETGEPDGSTPEPGSKEFWETPVEVNTPNGPQRIPLGQLRDGFMRQADYTRKTQEISLLRKKLGDAAEFLDQYQRDPAGFARAIAVEQGLVYPGDEPVAEVRGVKAPTPDEIQAQVERLAQERVQSDPVVQQAMTAQAVNVINAEFNRLEGVHHIQLPAELRESIVKESIERNVPDFDLLLRARLASVQDQQRQQGQLRGAAPSRPGMSPGAAQSQPGQAPEISTIEEAWKAAALEVSQLT
jgi:hypothetical protein